jgi:hypothetical protein
VKKLTRPAPIFAAVKLSSKAVLTCNFFAPVRTMNMDTETTEEEKTLLAQEAPRKPGGLPPIMMTSTTNLIRLQSNLKDLVNGEYKF